MDHASPVEGGNAPAGASESPRGKVEAPKIEKVKADKAVIHLEGHEYGEVMTRSQLVLYAFLYWLSRSIALTYFRLRIRGMEHVPESGAFIISPSHRSNLETPMISQITKRRLRYMGKESLWKTRFGAWMFTTAGGFPVERATADRGALRACQVVLERGEPLVMFPEGTRQVGPVIEQLFDGPAFLAIRTQSPILPVGFGGVERAMGKGTKIPRPTKCRVVIGEPIQPPPLGPSGRARRSDIKALTEQLRVEIQHLYDEAQEWAGTPNVKP